MTEGHACRRVIAYYYRVGLFAALAGLNTRLQAVDLDAGVHESRAFAKLNSWQQVPILIDGDAVIWDSQAILVYLAQRFDQDGWLPNDLSTLARVMQWLSVAANEVQHGPVGALLVKLYYEPLDPDAVTQASAVTLRVIDVHLAQNQWMAASHLTIADCAIYPYLKLTPEGGIMLDQYVEDIQRCMHDVEALPGYIGIDARMPRVTAWWQVRVNRIFLGARSLSDIAYRLRGRSNAAIAASFTASDKVG